jgi:hypothetical protein
MLGEETLINFEDYENFIFFVEVLLKIARLNVN